METGKTINAIELVEEIHNEFDSASQNILDEAQKILDGASDKLIEKAKRMQRIGFSNSREVKALNALSQQVNEPLINKIKSYQAQYKMKFITEEAVDKICDKYNLIGVPISNFTGTIPEKNLKEIEDCPVIAHSDRRRDKIKILKCWSQKNLFFQGLYAAHIHAKHHKEYFDENDLMDEGLLQDKDGTNIWIEKYETIKAESFMICCNKEDANISGLKKIGNKFMNAMKVTVPDPVILKPVDGGYLIVTKWGAEENIEEL